MDNDNSDIKKPSSLSEKVAELLMAEFDKKIPADVVKDETPSHDVRNLHPKTVIDKSRDDINDENLPYEFSIERRPLASENIEALINHQTDRKKIEAEVRKHVDIPVAPGFIAETTFEVDETYGDDHLNHDAEDYSPPFDDSSDEIEAEDFSLNHNFTIHEKPSDDREDVLKKICETKRQHIEWQKAMILESRLREHIYSAPATRGFISAINKKIASGENALIAEIKKASPSRGVIRHDFDPGMIAKAYAEGGATCLSILTDAPYFQGRDEYLNIARRACDLPLLRKDFILDPYQVVESRALGADCILLIMAALSDEQALLLEDEARKLNLDVLVEVHDERELQRALKLKTMLIGINNRNLKTLQIDLANTERLAPMIPYPRTVVCESGIYTRDDIARMNNARVKGFLVGESLMAQNDIKQATLNLLKH